MKLRLTCLALLLAFCLLIGGKADSSSRPQGELELTKLPPEVRLRKLHLVRPDLIQYPISFEVYC